MHKYWFPASVALAVVAVPVGLGQQFSPACEQLAQQDPPRHYEVEPAHGGFIQQWQVWHETHIVGPILTNASNKTYTLVNSIADANRTCETTTLGGSWTETWTDAWNVNGEAAVEVGAEAEAGIVLARAKTSCKVTVSVGAGWSGTTLQSRGFNVSSPLPPCSAKQHKTYVERADASATQDFTELIVHHDCVFSDCDDLDYQIECGKITIVAEVIGREISIDPADAGWTDLPAPNNCSDCRDEVDTPSTDCDGPPNAIKLSDRAAIRYTNVYEPTYVVTKQYFDLIDSAPGCSRWVDKIVSGVGAGVQVIW